MFRTNLTTLLLFVLILLVTANFIFSAISFYNAPRIAYVRSQNLIYGYAGMKEAQNRYQEKAQAWQTNIDTLKLDYQKSLAVYQQEYSKLSAMERQEREKMLELQKNNVIQYSDAIAKKAKVEEEKMTEGVLNQINSMVEEYGKRKGYDIIFGTTLSGNLLYGNSAMEISDELLDELNANYNQKK